MFAELAVDEPEEDVPEEPDNDGFVIWLIEVIGYSWVCPSRMSWGTPPEATWDESIAVTVEVIAGFPLVPGTVTLVPRNELPVARLWVCDIWFICWRVVNCASWAIVCVGSIGCRGSWLDISVLSSFMKSVVLMVDEALDVATGTTVDAADELVDETAEVADMGGVGSGKCAQMRGSAKGDRHRDRTGFGGLGLRLVGRHGTPARRASLPGLFLPAVIGAALGKRTVR